jgi:hypothetical protein
MSDKKPAIPPDFPLVLIELMLNGWSKDHNERPSIEEFKSALNTMLFKEEKDQSPNLPVDNSPNKKKEQLIPCEITEKELITNRNAGDIFVGQFMF